MQTEPIKFIICYRPEWKIFLRTIIFLAKLKIPLFKYNYPPLFGLFINSYKCNGITFQKPCPRFPALFLSHTMIFLRVGLILGFFLFHEFHSWWRISAVAHGLSCLRQVPLWYLMIFNIFKSNIISYYIFNCNTISYDIFKYLRYQRWPYLIFVTSTMSGACVNFFWPV